MFAQVLLRLFKPYQVARIPEMYRRIGEGLAVKRIYAEQVPVKTCPALVHKNLRQCRAAAEFILFFLLFFVLPARDHFSCRLRQSRQQDSQGSVTPI